MNAAPDIEFEPTARRYVSQGLTLSYVDWGNEGAPVLLFLHGNRDHARSWDAAARDLRRDWHVVALDLRGHGDSQWSPDAGYLSSYHVLDLADLVDALGCEQLTIVGHSFGGNIAARYAATFPGRVAKLVLVDGFGPPPDAFDHWAEVGPIKRTREWIDQRRSIAARPAKTFSTVEEAAGRLRAGNAMLSEEQASHLAFHGLRRQGEGFQWKCDPLVSVFAPEDFAADSAAVWRELLCPTLLCYGVKSWNRNPESDGRASHLRDYRVVGIEDAGHWAHHDQFTHFVATLRDFLGDGGLSSEQ